MSIQRLFNQTGTLKTRSGYDQYGKEVQNAGTTVNCRFQEVVKTRIHPDGSVEDIDAKAFVPPATNVNAGDHFIFNSIDYRVLYVNSVVDGRGTLHHYELRLTKWQS